SVETLRSNISSTQTQLTAVLHQIRKLESYPPHPQPRSETPTLQAASLSSAPDNQQRLSLSGSESSSSTTTTTTDRNTGTCNEVEAEAAMHHANVIFARHISLLKEYNEIKDVAMGMLSLIAEKEGRRLVEIMEERGLSEKD
ncbi:hypothetical protein A1O3_01287, partial [Capronia epimyces CBS 606.96]